MDELDDFNIVFDIDETTNLLPPIIHRELSTRASTILYRRNPKEHYSTQTAPTDNCNYISLSNKNFSTSNVSAASSHCSLEFYDYLDVCFKHQQSSASSLWSFNTTSAANGAGSESPDHSTITSTTDSTITCSSTCCANSYQSKSFSMVELPVSISTKRITIKQETSRTQESVSLGLSKSTGTTVNNTSFGDRKLQETADNYFKRKKQKNFGKKILRRLSLIP